MTNTDKRDIAIRMGKFARSNGGKPDHCPFTKTSSHFVDGKNVCANPVWFDGWHEGFNGR